MPRIVLDHLQKTFPAPDGNPKPAIDGVSLTLVDRELVTLVGPSGSGKTTLLRLIAGLETPDHGQISCDGTNVTWRPPHARDVALVFQSHALLPHFTAQENLAIGLKLRHVPANEIAARVNEIAGLLGITHCLTRRPAHLSGGERQRIALGRALIREPKILLLDEPFANLDEPLRAQFRSEFLRWRQRFTATILWVTHDQQEALALGDRVAVLRNGTLQQIATPPEIYARPANRFVATFIGTPPMNLFHGTIAQRESRLVFCAAEADDTTPPRLIIDLGGARADWFGANVGRRILLGIRPEHILPITSATGTNATRHVLATVRNVSFAGALLRCEAEIADRPVTFLAAPSTPPAAGGEVALQFDIQHAHGFDAATGVAIF